MVRLFCYNDIMNTIQIISLFLDRADSFGCVSLTAKQTAWLLSQYKKEAPGDYSSRKFAIGEYDFIVYSNDAGMLRPIQSKTETSNTQDEIDEIAELKKLLGMS